MYLDRRTRNLLSEPTFQHVSHIFKWVGVKKARNLIASN